MITDHSVRIRAGRIALLAGVVICAAKFAAYAATGSVAVFSDAMESVVNIAAAVLLLFSLYVAAQPADEDHPYGHGKIEFFSAGAEGTLIGVAGVLILIESVLELIRGPELRNLGAGLGIMAATAVANGVVGRYLIRTGREHDSLALEADGRHLMTDVVTSVGVFVGLAAVHVTGWAVLDPLMAIAVALHILWEGGSLVRRAIGGLMDEAKPDDLAAVVRGLVEHREPWMIDVHGLRTRRSGAVLHADLHVSVPRFFSADQLHELNDSVRDAVRDATGRRSDVLIHFDPCRPRLCPLCAMPDCPMREAEPEGLRELDVESAARGEEVLETGEPIPPRP